MRLPNWALIPKDLVQQKGCTYNKEFTTHLRRVFASVRIPLLSADRSVSQRKDSLFTLDTVHEEENVSKVNVSALPNLALHSASQEESNIWTASNAQTLTHSCYLLQWHYAIKSTSTRKLVKVAITNPTAYKARQQLWKFW